jgi:hypothetical protein
LKLDVRKYFDNIDHEILQQQLKKMFKDEKLLNIFKQIICSYNSNLTGEGVPIGNLCSQYFANHYLSIADHYVLEKTECSAYIRYMDDMVLWHNEKSVLLEQGREFRTFIEEHLSLVLKTDILHSSKNGLPFLGYLIFPERIRLLQKSKIRFMKKARLYETHLKRGRWSQKMYQNHITPLLGFCRQADTFNFRKKYFEELG